tara:strand:- start:174 stop:1133 length:960 start_codon:yes stop_codon:yes gene_type:complete
MGKARKLAAKLIQKDKGKLTASDLLRIKNKIKKKKGKKLNLNQISEVAENRTDKTVNESAINKFKTQKLATKLIKKDKGKLRAADLLRIQKKLEKKKGSTLKLKKIANLAGERTDKTFNKSVVRKAKTKKKVAKLKGIAEEAESKVKPFPGADGEKVKGKDFRKYKPQSKEIREAAQADLELRLAKKSTKPKVSNKAKNIKSEFKEGRKERKEKLKEIGDAKAPSFEDYKKSVEKIREGKGAAKEYAYSGKFKKLGEKLGVEYGQEAREKRTKDRLATLRKGLKSKSLANTYSTAADDAEQQRKKGKKALELFRGDSNQ